MKIKEKKVNLVEVDRQEKVDMERELREALWYCDRLASEAGLRLTYKIKGIQLSTKEPYAQGTSA